MPQKFAVGDRVAYSANFLRSTAQYTGEVPQLRGEVTNLEPWGGDAELATVKWDTDPTPRRINTHNLAKVGTPAMHAR